jgi:hypothetical protein
MRLIQASLQQCSVSTASFACRGATSAHRRCVAFFQASVMSGLIIGCVAYPSAHADATYGPGSYTVPGQLPYGIYIASAEPGDYSAACTFSTWTSDGKFISADSGIQTNSLTARILAPAVAKFITHGCTPWVKVE